jgi:hypothetical protein
MTVLGEGVLEVSVSPSPSMVAWVLLIATILPPTLPCDYLQHNGCGTCGATDRSRTHLADHGIPAHWGAATGLQEGTHQSRMSQWVGSCEMEAYQLEGGICCHV